MRERSAGPFLLRRADQEGQATGGSDQGGGGGEDAFEALDGAESDYVEGRADESLGADGFYIDVRQCKGAGDFAEKGGFLVVGLDEGESDVRGPEFYRDAGESGAGAEVRYADVVGRWSLVVGNVNVKIFHHRGHRGHRGSTGKQVAGGKEGFAEMAGDDFFGGADRCQINAGVPAEE